MSDDVLNRVRKELRDSQKQLKEKAAEKAELRAEVRRDHDIEGELRNLGHPVGMLETVRPKVSGPVSNDSVADALEEVGYERGSRPLPDEDRPGQIGPVVKKHDTAISFLHTSRHQ